MSQDFRRLRISWLILKFLFIVQGCGQTLPGYKSLYQNRGENPSVYRVCKWSLTKAFIWFKLPKNCDFFYLHYGNGGATSESDGKKVFTFFDHFEKKLDSTVWRLIAGSATVSKSILTLQNTSQSSVLESLLDISP